MTRADSTPFSGLVDLASERLGGKAILASDEFFAPKENLLKPGRGEFIANKYTSHGKWMDGWETRRKREPGYDWCIIKLGAAGVIKGVDIDTNHFLGNHPPYASIEAAFLRTSSRTDALTSRNVRWKEILPKSPLQPGSQNLFPISNDQRFTHVRLNIYPDGGVARLRVYGEAVPDWARYRKGELIDLGSIKNGGLAIVASDMFFSPMNNLIMPGRPKNMSDGWETGRRRGPGNDWVIIKLGRPGRVMKLEVDTTHFKGNYPDMCSVDACSETEKRDQELTSTEISWRELLPRTKLLPHRRHFFEKEIRRFDFLTHLRLNIFPDGGVGRFRAWGL